MMFRWSHRDRYVTRHEHNDGNVRYDVTTQTARSRLLNPTRSYVLDECGQEQTQPHHARREKTRRDFNIVRKQQFPACHEKTRRESNVVRKQLFPDARREPSLNAKLDLSNNASVHDETVALRARAGTRLMDPSEPLRRVSIVLMLNYARRHSSGPVSFTRQITTIVLTDNCFVCCVAFGIFLPLVKLVIGALFMNQCPAEPFIPTYLMLGGAVGTVRDVWILAMKYSYTEVQYEAGEKWICGFIYSLVVVEFAIFFAGCVLVYEAEYKFSLLPTDFNYCHPLFYRVAYWLVTVSLILLFMFGMVVCVLVVLVSCLEDELKEEIINEAMTMNHPDPKDTMALV